MEEATTVEILKTKMEGLEALAKERADKQDEVFSGIIDTLKEIRNNLVEHKIELVKVIEREHAERTAYAKEAQAQRLMCSEHRAVTSSCVAEIPGFRRDLEELTRDVTVLTAVVAKHTEGISEFQLFRSRLGGVVASASSIGGVVGVVIMFVAQLIQAYLFK